MRRFFVFLGFLGALGCSESRVVSDAGGAPADAAASVTPEQGCAAGDAAACLRAAASHFGEDAARVEKLADRGCQLDSHAWIRGTGGEELSCPFFDHPTIEDAARLGRECRGRRADSCRRLGDAIRPYDMAASDRAYADECSAGGLRGKDQESCVQFLAFLASPPTCPQHRGVTAPSYGRCPSEAKAPPKHMGSMTIASAKDEPLGRALIASDRVKLCYAAGLWDAPKLAGRVKLSVIVDARGHVRNVSSAGSELSDPMALECVVREAAALSVSPPPAAPKPVSVELELRP